jgi:hypothetical protein
MKIYGELIAGLQIKSGEEAWSLFYTFWKGESYGLLIYMD